MPNKRIKADEKFLGGSRMHSTQLNQRDVAAYA